MKYYLISIIALAISVSSCAAQGPLSVTPTTASSNSTVSTLVSTLAPEPSVTPTPEAHEDFKIVYNIELDQSSATGQTYFFGDYVVEMIPESDKADTIFNLAEMSWQVVDTGKTVRFADCETWVKASAEKTRASVDKLKDGVEKRFAESLLSPNFEIESFKASELILKNEFLLYRIMSSQTLSEFVFNRFYVHDRLSACHKAMVDRQLPLAQWAVSEVMEAHGIFPNKIEATIKTLKGDTVIRTSYTAEKMSESERDLVRSLLSK